MADKKNYIRWLREKVGHEKVILLFSGGCLLNEECQVLLQKRGDSGLWGFPGGAVEPGESPETAAIREVREETGLEVAVGSLIGVYTDCQMSYPNGDQAHSVCLAYRLQQTGGKLGSDDPETADLRWFRWMSSRLCSAVSIRPCGKICVRAALELPAPSAKSRMPEKSIGTETNRNSAFPMDETMGNALSFLLNIPVNGGLPDHSLSKQSNGLLRA